MTAENATTELVFQLLSGLLSVILTVLGVYARNWLSTSAFSKKYELENLITERTIANAVDYAEAMGRKKMLRGLEKRDLANKYIDEIDPAIISKYGKKLDLMLDRKVMQLANKRLEKTSAAG